MSVCGRSCFYSERGCPAHSTYQPVPQRSAGVREPEKLCPLVGDDELAASNVLRVGTDVVASGRYRAHGALERMGFAVHVVDLSEFLLADGGPTCLALAVDHLG
jgi:hypothetical protein